VSFETDLARLETIAASLDSDSLSLEESLKLFEEGIALLKQAHTALTTTEGRVQQLVEQADGVFEVRDVSA
jgi:exodeoxyribonuclease VII small subunit